MSIKPVVRVAVALEKRQLRWDLCVKLQWHQNVFPTREQLIVYCIAKNKIYIYTRSCMPL